MEISISFSLGIILGRNNQELKKTDVVNLYAVNKAMEIKVLSTLMALFVAISILGRGNLSQPHGFT